MERGIVILATGHPYYGRMAFNLAATIKATEKDFPVAVVHEGRALSHLSEQQMSVFDYLVSLPEDVPQGFATKLHLNELSPFKETLYVDADMLWLPKKTPSQLFDELKDFDYTGITEGYYDVESGSMDQASKVYYFWAEPSEIKSVYKLSDGKIYQWRSEVIYFKKNARVNKFFKKAQAINKNPKLTTQGKFGGQIPDELGINVSAAINKIEPHEYKWTPAYWHKLHRDIVPGLASLQENWYLISFGSNHANGSIKKMYDQVCRQALSKLGMQHVFGLHSKKDFLPQRSKM